MSTRKGRDVDFYGIGGRLSELVEEFANGNKANFAKTSDIPKTTFYGYLDGRNPKIEHLLKIREKYHVSLDWLLSGEGSRDINEQSSHPTLTSSVLLEVDAWLSELVIGEPGRKEWFRICLEDSFPMFKEWRKKRNDL